MLVDKMVKTVTNISELVLDFFFEINENFKFVDTDEDDIIMTGKQIDFMESEGLDTTGMRRFNNESISRGVANTHVFQETLKTRANSFPAHCQKTQKLGSRR